MTFAFKRIRYAYGNKIASVVHLAAYYDFLGKPSDLYDKITVKGTERLLKFLQDFEDGRKILKKGNSIMVLTFLSL